MSDLSIFFAGNAAAPEAVECVVSERFKKKVKSQDKDGKEELVPVPWQIRPISEEENAAIRAAATRKVKAKNGMMVPETNSNEYMGKLVAASVVFPNLNDADLQKSYGVLGADAVARKMLLSGEYANLVAKIQEINGFDKDINELADEVKN